MSITLYESSGVRLLAAALALCIDEQTIRGGKMKIRLALAAAALLWSCAAQSSEIKILSGNGARAAVAELSQRFERETGTRSTLDVAANPQVRKRILDGEAFDVAVLNPPVLDELSKAGKIVPETRSVLGRIGIGVGIKKGAHRPDLSSTEGFKAALLKARSVAYPKEGASGIYFENLLKRLGIDNEMKTRLLPMPGDSNLDVVATGKADMVVAAASIVWGMDDVELAGLLPDELQTWIAFAAGVSADAKDPGAARELVKFLVAAGSESFLRQIGMQPFVE